MSKLIVEALRNARNDWVRMSLDDQDTWPDGFDGYVASRIRGCLEVTKFLDPAALNEPLSVLRDLVAYWDATHPNAIDPDMDADLRVRLVEQGADLRRRVRRLVAEHTTDEETT